MTSTPPPGPLGRMQDFVRSEWKTIAITFQVFWIIVFALERVSSAGGGAVPQFVYMNF